MKFQEDAQLNVPDEKLFDYLLSETHPTGSSKAQFFKALGFSKKNHTLLRIQLVSLARFSEIVNEIETLHGTKYVIDGTIVTPTGQIAFIRTVWIRNKNSDIIRLVTAYPAKKERGDHDSRT